MFRFCVVLLIINVTLKVYLPRQTTFIVLNGYNIADLNLLSASDMQFI